MKKQVRIIARELITIVVILVVLESCSRLFAPVLPLQTDRDPLVGARYPRSMNEQVYNSEAKRRIWINTSAAGFRGPERSLHCSPGVHRVAVLGDSYISAEAVEEENTLINKLQDLLQDSPLPGESWEVMNFGVSGSSTADQLALYRHVVRDYDPDIVVIGYGTATDVVDNSAELTSHVRVRFRLTEEGALVRKSTQTKNTQVAGLLDRSQFYLWQKSCTNRLIKNIRRGVALPSRRDRVFAQQESEKIQRAWKLTAAILDQLDHETRRDGTQLVVMAVPCADQVYTDSEDRLSQRLAAADRFDPLHPDRRLKEICDRHQIPCLLMAEDFRQRAPSRLSTTREEWLFFHGAGHLNQAGHRAAAENLYRFLVGQQLLKVATMPGRDELLFKWR
jgi:hypothetical protein